MQKVENLLSQYPSPLTLEEWGVDGKLKFKKDDLQLGRCANQMPIVFLKAQIKSLVGRYKTTKDKMVEASLRWTAVILYSWIGMVDDGHKQAIVYGKKKIFVVEKAVKNNIRMVLVMLRNYLFNGMMTLENDMMIAFQSGRMAEGMLMKKDYDALKVLVEKL